MPVVCGVAGLALAAVTVAAPFYGVYRLVKRVTTNASTPSLSRNDSVVGSEWDVDIAEMLEQFYSPVELRRPLSAAIPLPSPATSAITSALDFEDVEIDHAEETLPPPLPPRQPICRVAVEPRRTPPDNSSADDSSVQSVEDPNIKALSEPLPVPPLPPRTTICRKSAESTRRPPPAVPGPSPHYAYVNVNQRRLLESASSETAPQEVTDL